MEEKSSLIIEAAVSLFADVGLSVSTAQISKTAGVSTGTLFNYFATKQDLIDAVFLSLKSELAEHLLSDAPPQIGVHDLLKRIWNVCVHWAILNPSKYAALQLLESSKSLSSSATQEVDVMFNYVRVHFENSIAAGEIVEQPVELLYCVIGGQLNSVANYALANGLESDELERLIAVGCEINWKGIQA